MCFFFYTINIRYARFSFLFRITLYQVVLSRAEYRYQRARGLFVICLFFDLDVARGLERERTVSYFLRTQSYNDHGVLRVNATQNQNGEC